MGGRLEGEGWRWYKHTLSAVQLSQFKDHQKHKTNDPTRVVIAPSQSRRSGDGREAPGKKITRIAGRSSSRKDGKENCCDYLQTKLIVPNDAGIHKISYRENT